MNFHVEDDINLYFEGGMPRSKRDALFGHLDRCDDCRGYFDTIADADRLLAQADILPPSQLETIRASVLDSGEVEKRAPFWRSWLIPALAAAVVLLFALPKDEWRAKGGAVDPVRPTIEVLCFDEAANIAAHRKASGVCPAPGFVKIIYASAQTVPHLTVAVRKHSRLELVSALTEPKPRSVLPDHVSIAVGDVLEIVMLMEPADETTLERAEPVLVVKGVAR